MVSPTAVIEAAREWIEVDPDPTTSDELQRLIAAEDFAALETLFSARLSFGTAGIRGELGPGPNRMNRVTIRRMAAGVAAHLGPGHLVVIGHDARHNSDVFAADAAAVLAAAGIRAHVIDRPVPTPVLAHLTGSTDADLGLMVTASHNPPRDNGCKVYLAEGAQLRSPVDEAIESAIDAVEIPPKDLPEPTDGGSVAWLGADAIDSYVAAVVAGVDVAGDNSCVWAYTPMHGVGRDVLLAACEATGVPRPHVVAEQAEPDPDFPTVAFPNPEEPGAMDLLLALAQRSDAQLAVANDPDADRLAVAVPTQTGEWRALTGDEVGALLFDHLAAGVTGDHKVVSTVVSSSMVSTMAAAAGFSPRVTLTGFKWLMAEAWADPDLPALFSYEESQGYATLSAVRDKDGISAAVRFVDLTHRLTQRGSSPAQRLDELAAEHGLHVTLQHSVRFAGGAAAAAAAVDALRANAPESLAGRRVVGFEDFALGGELPATNLLRFDLDGGLRVLVRPSGTEPKTKIYLEQVTPVATVAEVDAARQQITATLWTTIRDLEALLVHST